MGCFIQSQLVFYDAQGKGYIVTVDTDYIWNGKEGQFQSGANLPSQGKGVGVYYYQINCFAKGPDQ